LKSKTAKTAGEKFFRRRKRGRKCRIGNPPDIYLTGIMFRFAEFRKKQKAGKILFLGSEVFQSGASASLIYIKACTCT
jgi:hypothetical protein